jgi:hypothetical protein
MVKNLTPEEWAAIPRGGIKHFIANFIRGLRSAELTVAQGEEIIAAVKMRMRLP